MKKKALCVLLSGLLLNGCGSSDEENKLNEENSAPTIVTVSKLSLKENSKKVIPFTVKDLENDPFQISLENNSNSNFSAYIEGNNIIVETKEILEDTEDKFVIVAADNKSTTRKEITLSIINKSKQPVIEVEESFMFQEDEVLDFKINIKDEDSEKLNISLDYDNSLFNMNFDYENSKLNIEYKGDRLTKTVQKEFNLKVSDGYNEVTKTIKLIILPINNNPVIVFENSEIIISEGDKKYLKLNINDDKIGELDISFAHEIVDLNVSLIENENFNIAEGYVNNDYPYIIELDASNLDFQNDNNSFFEIIVKDKYEGIDAIIEKKRVNLKIKNKLNFSDLTFNENSTEGIQLEKLRYETNIPFVLDLMKQAGKWTTHCFSDECNISGDTNENYKLNKDNNGWVKELPDFTLSDDNKYSYIKTKITNNYYQTSGDKFRFYVFYKGHGRLTYGNVSKGSNIKYKNQELSQPYMDVIEVPVNSKGYVSELTINIEATNKENYLRDIQVIPEGGYCNNIYTYAYSKEECEGNFVHFVDVKNFFDFHPILLNKVKNYKIIDITNLYNQENNLYFNNEEIDFYLNNEDKRRWTEIGNEIPFSKLLKLSKIVNSDIKVSIPNFAYNIEDWTNNLQNELLKNKFDNKLYLTYGTTLYKESDLDSQSLLNYTNTELTSEVIKIEEKRNLGLEEKLNITTTEKILAAKTLLTKKVCDGIEEAGFEKICLIEGFYELEKDKFSNQSKNETLLECDIAREKLKKYPETLDNKLYWENNNCSVFIDRVSINPKLADYLTEQNILEMKTWNDETETELFNKMEQELNISSIFREDNLSAIDLHNYKLLNLIQEIKNYNIDVISTGIYSNFNSEELKSLMNKIKNSQNNNLWYNTYTNYLNSWKENGGNELIISSKEIKYDNNDQQQKAIKDYIEK